MDLNEMYDERARIWDSMKATMEVADKENRDLNVDERTKYDAAEKDLDAISGRIERAKKHIETSKLMEQHIEQTEDETRTAEQTGEGADAIAYRQAFAIYVTRGMESLSNEQKAVLRTGYQAEDRAQSVGTTTAGGYLVPQGFREKLVEQLKSYGNVRAVSEQITTETGNSLPWPTMDDTSNAGHLLAENTQMTTTDFVVGQATLAAYMFTSDLVLVSEQLMEDVPWLRIEALLARKLGERISRGQNGYFTTGTGSSQPQGIVTGAATGVTAANSSSQVTAVTYDSLIDLIHSVDAAYRDPSTCKWMFNDLTLAAFRKLKDGNSRPLWEPSLTAGDPDRLLGYPTVVNNQMAVMAASAKSILFGDFEQGYIVRDVRDIAIRRLNERYADFLQVGFFGFARADGKVQNTSAYKLFVNAAS